MAHLFERVTIAGPGLIGGSLALAARAAGLVGEVVGLARSAETLAEARRRGIVDRASSDPLDAARGANLLVLAVPVRAIATVARQCLPVLAPGCVVTDAGSVKAPIVRELEALMPPGQPFVGAHPIAGTEEQGPAAADPDLFRHQLCIITPSAQTDAAAAGRIQALWEGVGMRVERMSPERHDDILAAVSHLPHVIAFALVNAVVAAGGDLPRYRGGSLRDATRVASSSVEMWRDILLTNAAAVDAALARFSAELERLRGALRRGDEAELVRLLVRASAERRGWSRES
ncbi:MAG: prephenate dehydrogenase/arogenate dehydrogenase family protein [Deltaproteobacteria bacterium]|nr:prephenate dehydrogenase/arogenate dehydrogenase family protein [Deltaproteobacteria bacterium]